MNSLRFFYRLFGHAVRARWTLWLGTVALAISHKFFKCFQHVGRSRDQAGICFSFGIAVSRARRAAVGNYDSTGYPFNRQNPPPSPRSWCVLCGWRGVGALAHGSIFLAKASLSRVAAHEYEALLLGDFNPIACPSCRVVTCPRTQAIASSISSLVKTVVVLD